MGKGISFRLPKRLEIFLLVAAALTLFLMDINVNKVADLGVDYRVTVFSSFQPLAINVFIFGLVLYHILLVGLILRAIVDKGTHLMWDALVGMIVVFGTYIVVSGAILQIQGIKALTFWDVLTINFYHVGIALQIIGLLYYSLTD